MGCVATSRRSSSQAMRTSSSWPEWSNTTSTRPACRPSCSGWRTSIRPSLAAAEGVFREETGRTALEAILVGCPSRIRVGPGPSPSTTAGRFGSSEWSSTGFGSWTPIRRERLYRPTGMSRRPSRMRSGASTRPVPTRPSGGGPRRLMPRPFATRPEPGPPAWSRERQGEKAAFLAKANAHGTHPVPDRIPTPLGYDGHDPGRPAQADPRPTCRRTPPPLARGSRALGPSQGLHPGLPGTQRLNPWNLFSQPRSRSIDETIDTTRSSPWSRS